MGKEDTKLMVGSYGSEREARRERGEREGEEQGSSTMYIKCISLELT